MAKKLNLVDMYGIGVMLEYLVAEDNLTCEERDRVILRIARENDIAEYMYCVNPAHVLAHLPNARKELDNWMASIG